MDASQKLSHLLQLADQGPVMRDALAEEIAELLIAWPSDYPPDMRATCETMLASVAQAMEATARARLRVILHAEPALAHRLLPRESCALGLIAAARNGQDLCAPLAQALGVDGETARHILNDTSGATLAIACKGANIDRAAFSALTLLLRPDRARGHAFAILDTFDTVTTGEATRILRNWREGTQQAA